MKGEVYLLLLEEDTEIEAAGKTKGLASLELFHHSAVNDLVDSDGISSSWSRLSVFNRGRKSDAREQSNDGGDLHI